ncbi:hypothetical protein DAEQUDRAFT_763071 [Daedalea quercina L-15889]|uniref:Uncharacterized protein n=1 Tax=Daedalea quercina L-15889 TaxID=1314783 RepID=A0A165SQN4_9APHY|nr:hypothetical protein DAEQUDRAFT_763071 [Daedalea quercina L-15889]
MSHAQSKSPIRRSHGNTPSTPAMLLINVKHDNKDLPPVPGKPEDPLDAPPAYEPVASTSYNPFVQEAVSAPAQLVQEPATCISTETVAFGGVFDDADQGSSITPSPPAPRPSLREEHVSESNVTLSVPQPSLRRVARSELSLPSSTSRRPQSGRRSSDHRISRPYGTVRLSSAPPLPSDKSEKNASRKSFGGHVTPQNATEIMSGFLRDLLARQFTVEQSAEIVLKGCADACRVYGLSLATLLQESSVEGHTPIYWAIVKCSPDPESTFTHELLAAFLTYAAPLTEATLSDIRLACLENPDQELFQWIRRSPSITPLFGAADVLFSGAVPKDEVIVEELPGENDMFVGHFRLLMFQKRMRVLKQVALEFIARGRLWSLQIYVATNENARKMRHRAKPGAWVVTLGLLEGSQPTWVDSGFIVCKNDGTATQAEGSEMNWLRLKSSCQLMAPPRLNNVNATFKEGFAVQCLSPGNIYVQPDGALGIRLEASLKPQETGCVIC